MDWCTIESDPGVFTELIQRIGVKDVQVEELWGLDDEVFEPIKPVYGLIFLFKWVQEEDNRPVDSSAFGELFFARQVITNACATQAILSILLNSPELELGSTLGNFKSFATALDPEMAGEAINGMDDVRQAHNSFSRPEPLLPEEKRVASGGDDVFHFIAYIPHNGKLYELDGLKPGPICLGEHGDADWVSAVRPHIQERIQRYASSEIRFNLMAVVKDQRVVLGDAVEAHSKRQAALEAALEQGGGADAAEDASFKPIALEAEEEEFAKLVASGDAPALRAQLEHERRARAEAVAALERTERKFEKWRAENVRRKHNYIPLCVAMLDILAKKGKLEGLIDAGKRRQQERRAAAAKNKQQEQTN